MKQYTLDEYTKIYGYQFIVNNLMDDSYYFDNGDCIDPNHPDWEKIKDEIILGIDETLNKEITLFIHQEDESEEEEREYSTEDQYWDFKATISMERKYFDSLEEAI